MADNLKDIAAELKVIRKVLERMTQAPIFSKVNPPSISKPVIHYICDNKACDKCNSTDCRYTSRIDHAINFYFDRESGTYIELPSEDYMYREGIKI